MAWIVAGLIAWNVYLHSSLLSLRNTHNQNARTLNSLLEEMDEHLDAGEDD